MNVTYIGFGGTMDVPCYKDEKGNLYFDVMMEKWAEFIQRSIPYFLWRNMWRA